MVAELSHKLIVDGWFREISEQWPGNYSVKSLLYPMRQSELIKAISSPQVKVGALPARPEPMTLRVKKILHMEQSVYQDVLVFESTDHGNVLVLDGAIQ
ncbi:hypothetical protein P7C70_g6158, partial [Phenoliferia sp. Uapishka_3]